MTRRQRVQAQDLADAGGMFPANVEPRDSGQAGVEFFRTVWVANGREKSLVEHHGYLACAVFHGDTPEEAVREVRRKARSTATLRSWHGRIEQLLVLAPERFVVSLADARAIDACSSGIASWCHRNGLAAAYRRGPAPEASAATVRAVRRAREASGTRLGSGMTAPGDRLTAADVAALADITPASVRQCPWRGTMPVADGYFGRTPYWDASTVETWLANRRRRGQHAPKRSAAPDSASSEAAELWAILHASPAPWLSPPVEDLEAKTSPHFSPAGPWCAARLELGLAHHPDAASGLGGIERCVAWAWLDHF